MPPFHKSQPTVGFAVNVREIEARRLCKVPRFPDPYAVTREAKVG